MTAADLLPDRFALYRDRHRGASMLVCGCGSSLALLEQPERWLTIGVNDVGRRFTPDYLVILNERRQFDRDRYAEIERTQAKAVFTQLAQLELPQTRVVRFRLGRRGGTERSEGDELHYSNNSPYVAVNLARHFGAERIGLIGVDFCDDHFFAATGRHPLAGQLPQIKRDYAALAAACRADGVELVNLSPTSRLTVLPRMSLAEWAVDAHPARASATAAPDAHPTRAHVSSSRDAQPAGAHPTSARDARPAYAHPTPARDAGPALQRASSARDMRSACAHAMPAVDTQPAPGCAAPALSAPATPASAASSCGTHHAGRRVFFVHYRFLSCGTVFEIGLREAAAQLGLVHEHADWDDARLPQKIERFAPALLFIVHGRRYLQRWGARFVKSRSAVWLLDEPYEVDDTAVWSGRFDTVFVNDPATLGRHRHAHALQAAYAPSIHHSAPDDERPRRVGFIGGANPSRETLLAGLARRGLLDYVIGGPWRDPRLAALCLAPNVPAERTAALYRETAIVLNVFRDRHHYNRAALPALAMNPRIVEALACGALVLSEPRALLEQQVPELPTFRSETEAAALIERFLADAAERRRVRRACAARLAEATYLQRLSIAMDTALEPMAAHPTAVHAPSAQRSNDVESIPDSRADEILFAGPMVRSDETAFAGPMVRSDDTAFAAHIVRSEDIAFTDRRVRRNDIAFSSVRPDDIAFPDCIVPFDDDWDDLGGVVRRREAGELVIDPGLQCGPGFERGLTSRRLYEAVELAFEACLEPGALLVAKLHQADRLDQTSNSYHLLADERRAYLARHRHVFRHLEPSRSAWVRWRLRCDAGVLALWRNDRLIHRVRDAELQAGYAFIGAQGGLVRLRGLELAAVDRSPAPVSAADDEAETLQPVRTATPRLSIVTTVYDRTQCLHRCIDSVGALAFRDYEHLIVADHPPPEVLASIGGIVARADDPRIGLYDLRKRHNNWGIAPAAAGLRRARGEFVAFLSDDNGYLPDHMGALIRTLDRDPALGFVSSSCQYDGRLVLAHAVPRPGRIDLGQLLFRRELFELHLNDDLPFDMMAWDWHLVDRLMRCGVRWRHVDRPSFIFRLAKYPHLMVEPAVHA